MRARGERSGSSAPRDRSVTVPPYSCIFPARPITFPIFLVAPSRANGWRESCSQVPRRWMPPEWSSSVWVYGEQSLLDYPGDDLGSGTETQLAQDLAGVGLDGAFGYL